MTSGENTISYITLGKLPEMFSEIASSHVTYFWFNTCSVSLPVVLLFEYVFVVVLFHGIKPAQQHNFLMTMCLQRTTKHDYWQSH